MAKFYRPHRWDDATILEEHEFAYELAAAEIPVIAPIQNSQGESLFHYQDFRFALFERKGGYALELDNLDQLYQIGQFMGRIHAVGRSKAFQHRPTISIESYLINASRYLLRNEFIPKDLIHAYSSLIDQLIELVEACFQRAGELSLLRLHGDCHPSNILIRDSQLHIVDLDDARSGPAAQDLWMFLAGDRAEQTQALSEVLAGYSEFCEFNPRELHLFEALRTMRLTYYHAWLARRWQDPAFPQAFPWFNQQKCWEDHVLTLREQAALLTEQPLQWL